MALAAAWHGFGGRGIRATADLGQPWRMSSPGGGTPVLPHRRRSYPAGTKPPMAQGRGHREASRNDTARPMRRMVGGKVV